MLVLLAKVSTEKKKKVQAKTNLKYRKCAVICNQPTFKKARNTIRFLVE